MTKLILRNEFSAGDIVLLTAALRDLHASYPNEFLTDVRTPFPELWHNNPHITPLDETKPDSKVVKCSYPLINKSNYTPHHVIHGFIQFLNDQLGVNIKPTNFKGDIHLSSEEKNWDSQIHEIVGEDIPFWIVVAGGKTDVTIKWWDAGRYQEIVNHFSGRIQFVQVGAMAHNHPKLEGVIDLRGKTDMRQLVRLVYHAQGVICPVTLLMHLAAAVEVKDETPKNRPCVVIAGGREPSSWEAYPHHQFIHTNGALRCCDNGGCWKSRTIPLGDGDERDGPENLCLDVVGKLPRCMDMITSTEVIRRIEMYFDGGAVKYLSAPQVKLASQVVSAGERRKWKAAAMEEYAFQRAAKKFIKQIPAFPGNFQRRGIVISGGGKKYFPCAWVCINMLRHFGCSLPIELWHLGNHEVDARMAALLKPLGVECIDAQKEMESYPARILNGYELKAYSIIHSKFKEVLLLDADNVPVVNPEFLFDTPEYRECGSIFWPDVRPGLKPAVWKVFGPRYRKELEFESGQIVIDKEKCWKAINLAMWYNEHSDFYYRYVLGDKDTFHMAFRMLKIAFAWVHVPVAPLNGAMCQHDFSGKRIFQHRNTAKWQLNENNPKIQDFWFETECFRYLKRLRKKWTGTVGTDAANNSGKKRLVFRGPINAFTGYGLHSCQIISDLGKLGNDVLVRPTHVAETFAKVPKQIRAKFVSEIQPDEWELMLHPPNLSPTPGKKTIFFTMWEATRLPTEWVGFLNQAECIILPCQWNASCFSASGVTKPIRVVPLGIKTDVFKYFPMKMTGPCVFGAAARTEGGGLRKGLNEMVELFIRAFPTEKDVLLKVKAFPDCAVRKIKDPRIEISKAYFSERRLSGWYSSLTCFVSLSRSEGWGLMPHQAMGVGRPCITTKFGGQMEYFNEAVGYSAEFRLVPAAYNYTGFGHWAEPDEDHVIDLMRRVYRNRKEAQKLGQRAAKVASQFCWQKSNQKLLQVLKEVGMVA